MTVLFARCGYARCGTTRCDIRLPHTQAEYFDMPPWAHPDIIGIPNGYGGQYIIDVTGATSGTFTLDLNGGGESSAIAYNATPAQVAAVLGAGYTVTGRPGLYTVTADAASPLTIDLNGTSLGGAPVNVATQTRTGQPTTSSTPSLPTTLGGEAEDVTVEASSTAIYTIDIVDPDGDLVETVADLSGGRFRQSLDQASDLNFRVPGTSDQLDSIVRPNRLFVRDRYGFLLDTFDPIERSLNRPGGDAYFLDVKCLSVLARLQKEPVVYYSGTSTGEAHIAGLLSMQSMTPPITVGAISPQVAEAVIALDLQDTTILGALRQIQDSLPKADAGHFYVDGLNRLQWPNTMGDQSGTTLAVGRHIQGVTATYNYQEQVNRLYMYGAGQDPQNRLKLNSLNANEEQVHATEYWEDAASISTYGLVTGPPRVDRRFHNVESLLEAAKRIVEEYKEPHLRISAKVIDLSKSINYSGYPALYIGSTYLAVDSWQGLSIEVTTKSLTHDMDRPLNLQIELDNRGRTLADILGSVISQVNAIDVDVMRDGDRYPGIARTYSLLDDILYPLRRPKKGDVLVDEDNNDEISIYDGTNFVPVGATGGDGSVGAAIYVAANYAALPSDVPAQAIGITRSDPVAMYIRNAGNDTWVAVSRWADVS